MDNKIIKINGISAKFSTVCKNSGKLECLKIFVDVSIL
jgi:hypothetical protein